MNTNQKTQLFCDLPDEVAENINGGNYFMGLLRKVVNWVGSGNNGSTSGALKSTGKAVIAAPLIGGLALASFAEMEVRGNAELGRKMVIGK